MAVSTTTLEKRLAAVDLRVKALETHNTAQDAQIKAMTAQVTALQAGGGGGTGGLVVTPYAKALLACATPEALGALLTLLTPTADDQIPLSKGGRWTAVGASTLPVHEGTP